MLDPMRESFYYPIVSGKEHHTLQPVHCQLTRRQFSSPAGLLTAHPIGQASEKAGIERHAMAKCCPTNDISARLVSSKGLIQCDQLLLPMIN